MRLLGCLADRGNSCPAATTHYTGRWQCAADPTPEQAFLGNLFRKTDIELSRWPDGFAWEHVGTGERRYYANGRLKKK